MILTKSAALLIAAGCVFITNCGSVTDAWTTRREASAASNQMMLVRENPGTLGYRRLLARSAESEDLRIFLDQTGTPDFLAEAKSSEREYLIFYYLEKRQAFACRTRGGRSGPVEFSGPYPMTAGEIKLLTAARKKAGEG